MKVHLNQISPEGLHLEGEDKRDILGLEDEKIRAAGPIRYSLEIGLSGGGMFATGRIALDVDLECVNCLEPMRYPVRIDSFAMQTQLGGGETVDLTPWVREDIILALPPHPHCDWDKKKVCPGPSAYDQPAEPENQEAWAELNKLVIKK